MLSRSRLENRDSEGLPVEPGRIQPENGLIPARNGMIQGWLARLSCGRLNPGPTKLN